MEYKQLTKDTRDLESIYSLDSTIIRDPKAISPPPSYKRILTPNVKKYSKLRRFLATEIRVKHILLLMVIYWVFFYINEAISIPYWLGVAWSCVSDKVSNLFGSETSMHVINEWNTRENGVIHEEDVYPALHSNRLQFNGRDI